MFALVGAIVGAIIDSSFKLTMPVYDLAFVFAAVFFVVVFITLVRFFLSEIDNDARKHEQYLIDNPTIAEFIKRFPDLYSELSEQNPDAFGQYCRRCSEEMRIKLTPESEEYDPNTGELISHKLKVFCSADHGHCHDVTVFQKKKKKIAQFQGDLVVVVEDDGTNARLPQKLESIR
jgi:signal-transduction protein with cAMP-binding, CBS, and nucleotidyltransferase domain